VTFLFPVLALGGTGLVCGVVLAIAARKFAVTEDPRVQEILEALPGANCGACGVPGCAEYAKAVAQQKLPIDLCKRGGAATLARLSALMGVKAEARERQVAIVLCQGDDSRAVRRGLYNGLADCVAANAMGGDKGCRYGCLGLGSCARVCPAGAIEIKPGRLAEVHPDLCIGCGLCVQACPRGLIRLVPESRRIHVLCRSRDRGPVVKKLCSVGCIGCGLCAKIVGNQGIRMEGPLAVVDYGVQLENDEVTARCPQHSIASRPGRRQA